jgi:hypothetical protein
MTVDKESLRKFEEEFNISNRTIADFLKLIKHAGITIDDFGEPTEIDNGFSWRIDQIWEIRQCEDCKAIEFIEIGQQPKNRCK